MGVKFHINFLINKIELYNFCFFFFIAGREGKVRSFINNLTCFFLFVTSTFHDYKKKSARIKVLLGYKIVQKFNPLPENINEKGLEIKS